MIPFGAIYNFCIFSTIGIMNCLDKYIWKIILDAGDFLKDKLPSHPSHPKGRNPYAHVALEIKNHFGVSYRDISDEKVEEIIDHIKYIKNNPS